MSLEEKIGQLFVIAPDGEWEASMRDYHVGGVILFSRHCPTIEATLRLIDRARRLSAKPPLIAVDQEGGRVSRLSFATPVPDARSMEGLSEISMETVGMIAGQELRVLGFNLNLAPVLDIASDPRNPLIERRAFSSDPAAAGLLGRAYINGLHAAGITASAKHFPGHGGTSDDSHFTLPVSGQTQEVLRSRELVPFRAAIDAGTDTVMVAHVHYPALDGQPDRPASLSPAVIDGLLRKELHYDGVVLTDAMNMQAITRHMDPGAAALAAFRAGADIILMSDDLPAAWRVLRDAVHNGRIPVSRLDASLRRILRLKASLPDDSAVPWELRLQTAISQVGSETNRHKMAEALNASPTLSKQSGAP